MKVNVFLKTTIPDDMHVCSCGPGGRWWQPTTGSMAMYAVTCRLTAYRVRDQLRPLTLDYEYGKPLPLPFYDFGSFFRIVLVEFVKQTLQAASYAETVEEICTEWTP